MGEHFYPPGIALRVSEDSFKEDNSPRVYGFHFCIGKTEVINILVDRSHLWKVIIVTHDGGINYYFIHSNIPCSYDKPHP
jgi:hypothetical protein